MRRPYWTTKNQASFILAFVNLIFAVANLLNKENVFLAYTASLRSGFSFIANLIGSCECDMFLLSYFHWPMLSYKACGDNFLCFSGVASLWDILRLRI